MIKGKSVIEKRWPLTPDRAKLILDIALKEYKSRAIKKYEKKRKGE